MVDQKERYVVTLTNGKQFNAKCATFIECVIAFGEENIKSLEKLDYQEEE